MWRKRADFEEEGAQYTHATLATAVERSINRAGDLRHEDLGRFVVSGPQERAHRIQWRVLVEEAGEQGGLPGEEGVQRGAGDAGLSRQVVHRQGVEAVRAHQVQGHVEDALASTWFGLKVERLEERLARLEVPVERRSGYACRRGELCHRRATSLGEQVPRLGEDPFPGRYHLVRD